MTKLSQSQPTSNHDVTQPMSSDEVIVDDGLLTREETRKILTPFAFKIDKSLFGLPLASPIKRAVALLVDFIIIALLAEAPGEWLALFAAYALFKLARRNRNEVSKTKTFFGRFIIRGLALLIMVIAALSYVAPLINQLFDIAQPLTQEKVESNIKNANVANLELGLLESVPLTALIANTHIKISESDCYQPDCWQSLLADSVVELNKITTDRKNKETIIRSWVDESSLTVAEKDALHSNLVNVLSDESIGDKVKQQMQKNLDDGAEFPDATETKTSSTYRGIEWLKGIIDDLGLSFGWAALYFSVLTARWQGQTVGKKLMKIRVIQLDGSPLSIWDSFGRYGGYGAGLATGLLGFLQIFWDANRQCIHDKISATVVINLRKK